MNRPGDIERSSQTARLRAISEVTRAFAEATEDYQQLLEVVVRRTSEAVVGFCALGLVSDDGRWLEPAAAFDPDPAALALLRRIFGSRPAPLADASLAMHAQVIHGGESLLMAAVDPGLIEDRVAPDDATAALGLAVRSLLMVPLRVRGRSLGALTVLRWGDGATPLDEHDLALVEILAGHAASALANAGLLAAARRDAESRFRALIEHSGDGISLRSADGTVLYQSPAIRRILDLSETEGADNQGLDWLYPDAGAEQVAGAESLTDPGSPHTVELHVRGRDGNSRWVEVTTTNLLRDPAVRALVSHVRDVTERHRTLEQLRSSVLAMRMDATRRRAADEEQARLAAILESCDEAILGKDLDGRITSWNDGAARLYGYTREEMLGRSATVLVRADRPDEEAQLLARIARGERVVHFETVRIGRDGTHIPVSLSASPIRDAEGHVVGASSIARDLTAQYQVAVAQDESARAQQLFFDASPVPIIIFDATTLAFVAVNDAATKLYGYERAEFLGLRLPDLRLPEEQAAMEAGLQEAGEDGWDGTSTHRRKDGSILQVEILARSHELRGRLVRVAAMQDVTEKLRLEAQLRQSQKMDAIGRLAGGVAHDFNNLLSVILGYTELALSDLPPNEPLRDDLVEVQRAGERAAGLTQQLLAFSRQQVLDPRVVDFAEVVAGTEKMLRRLVGEDVNLTLLADPGSGRCLVDPGQVEQVVMNLVVNARDAMPLGGRLTIETSRVDLDADYAASHLDFAPGPYVLLAVSDTGSGMDQVTQARIFEPFFTTKDKSKGTGLGLSTVFGIVKQSGGHLWVYSEPGVGTTFKVYFPLVTTEMASSPTILPPAVSTRGTETVLLVEDEEAVRTLVRNVLRRSGYHVIDAANPGEALLHSEQFGARIHLLITDVIMPQMSGRQLAERLAPLRPDMRVLYMSGYTENSIVHHGVLDAGIAFLPKPVTPAALLRRVREVLDESRAG